MSTVTGSVTWAIALAFAVDGHTTRFGSVSWPLTITFAVSAESLSLVPASVATLTLTPEA